ncbi:MAG: hypothetical protein CMJ75_08415 [Planctomycetaceae bacterium]|nr:hypothetical protein [Planctomycetaceae bacterium]
MYSFSGWRNGMFGGLGCWRLRRGSRKSQVSDEYGSFVAYRQSAASSFQSFLFVWQTSGAGGRCAATCSDFNGQHAQILLTD